MLGPERQAAVANLESMGFPRAECERAMRAAFYNPDRAVEYLINVSITPCLSTSASFDYGSAFVAML